MKIRVLFTGMIIFCAMATLGCETDVERMNGLCDQIHKISLQTDDCDKMAKNLASATVKFQKAVEQTSAASLPEADRRPYIEAVSKCTRHYLEISSGPCGENPNVKAAMPKR